MFDLQAKVLRNSTKMFILGKFLNGEILSTLSLTKVQVEHSGEYTCQVTFDKERTVTAISNLFVSRKLKYPFFLILH